MADKAVKVLLIAKRNAVKIVKLKKKKIIIVTNLSVTILPHFSSIQPANYHSFLYFSVIIIEKKNKFI